MPGSLTFITGGARCGKSGFAEQLARTHRGPVAFVATASVQDREMSERVARHRARRPLEWTTFECDGSISATVQQAAETHALVLVDCIGMYLSGLLPPEVMQGETVPAAVGDELDQRIDVEMTDLVGVMQGGHNDFIVVSNEVGSGLVPPYPAGRAFRDVLGRANQFLARKADYAFLVVAGQVLDLKALGASQFPWEIGH